jgi:hypothetical protein
VDVREGKLLDDFSGRTWQVEVHAPADARAAEKEGKDNEQERKRQAKDRDDEAKVLAALDDLDAERQGVSFTKIRAVARISGDRVRGALVRLVRAPDKPVEEIEVRSKGGNGAKIRAEGYRRRPKEGSEHEHPEHRD